MRNGYTLWDLAASATIIGIMAAIALPSIQRLRDRAQVHAALLAVRSALTAGRRAATTLGATVTITVDSARSSISVADADGHVLLAQSMGDGPQLSASRASVRYGPSGRGLGPSNTTILLTQGASAETLTVSRLGRVRQSRAP